MLNLSKSLSRKKLHQVSPLPPPSTTPTSDTDEQEMSKCPRCGKPVYFAERKVILGKDWHAACLRCGECDKQLTPGQHSAHHEKPYCNACYQRLFGPDGYRQGTVIEPRKFAAGRTNSGDMSAAEKQEIMSKIREYNLYKDNPKELLKTREINGRIYFEGILKIYWGLQRSIKLSPGVMYLKNRNSRASTYDPFGIDDATYAAMLEEAAKVRMRKEQFEQEKKIQGITEKAWNSQNRMPRPATVLEESFEILDPLTMSLPPELDGSTSLPGTLERRRGTRHSDGTEDLDESVDGAAPSKSLTRGTSVDPGVFNSRASFRKRSASFRRISRIKKKEERSHDSKREFIPPRDTPTNIRIHSAIGSKDVITMLLAKFKIENDPAEFGLCVMYDNGFKEPCKDDVPPLLQRLKLGPNEDIAKIYIMEASECKDIEMSTEVQEWIKFSLHELDIFCRKFNEEETREEDKIKKKFSLWKGAVAEQLKIFRNSHNSVETRL